MEENLQTKIIQLEYLNQQIQAMQAHLSEIMKAVDELSVLKVGLQNMKSARAGDEVLIPLGAASYVHGTLSSVDRVLVSIGAGIYMEKPIDEALPIVDKQIEELQKQEETVVGNVTLLSQEAERLSQEVNAALKAGGNV